MTTHLPAFASRLHAASLEHERQAVKLAVLRERSVLLRWHSEVLVSVFQREADLRTLAMERASRQEPSR
jgi:hypothetical protein